jgi:uncharacterized protein with NAD-binding domain and iron-sulfur cluster/uncharacterized protein YqjF (DUF2071 family)
MTAKKVLVMGGGVAGLTVAHELAERGYKVVIYDRNPSVAGGKARTEPAVKPRVRQTDGTFKTEAPLPWNNPWPGEHGFRFFPGFYKHVPDTMRRIPFADNPRGVFDNLLSARLGLMAPNDYAPFPALVRAPRTWEELKAGIEMPEHYLQMGLTPDDLLHFFHRIWQIATSCKARRLDEYGRIGWWDFIDASARSAAYQHLLAIGITRNAVATQATIANTRTIGDVMVSLLFNMTVPFETADRVLIGPTNEAWIDPWVMYLTREFGVEYVLGATVKALHYEYAQGEGRLSGVTIRHNRKGEWVETVETADHYVSALPVEVLAELLAKEARKDGRRGKEAGGASDPQAPPGPPKCILDADEGLEGILQLKSQVNWMTGIQFYLTDAVEVIAGHINCLDSPWSITALSQLQFWPSVEMPRLGDGKATCIVSVDISNWDAKGSPDGKVPHKTAKECTPDEIAEETWHQLKRALNHPAGSPYRIPERFHAYWLDDAIIHNPKVHKNVNTEPLLVNLVGSWPLRPKAYTRLPNFYVAGDFVQTHTDFASMESACEAGRRAANAMLARDDYRGPLGFAEVWDVHEHEIFKPLQEIDAARYAQGLPWSPTVELPHSRIQHLKGEVQEAKQHVKEAARALSPVRLLTDLKEGIERLTGTPKGQTVDDRAQNIIERNAGRLLLPSRPWAMLQGWEDLLVLSDRVEAGVLQSLLPPDLEPDIYDGSAWVSLVAMNFTEALLPIPSPVQPASGFPQMNLRAYVRHQGQPGVYFFHNEVPSDWARFVAKDLFDLPYRKAQVTLRKDKDGRFFFSCRRADGGEAAQLECSYKPSGPGRLFPKDSLPTFLSERFAAFSPQRRLDGSWGKTSTAPIIHDPWPLDEALELDVLRNNYWEKEGVPLMKHAPPGAAYPKTSLALYTPGSDAVIWTP